MEWIKQIVQYIAIMFIQVLLIGNLHFMGMCHPYIYIICLMTMPITLSVPIELIIGAIVGFIMDLFLTTPGVHMAACTLLMYLRRSMIPHLVFEPERLTGSIDSSSLGMSGWLQYIAVLTLVHHAMIQILSAWSFHHIGWIILSIIISAFISLVLIILYDLIHTRQ